MGWWLHFLVLQTCSLRLSYTGFLDILLLFWSLKWAFICLEHKWWTWQDLLMMKLLEAGVLDVKLGSLSRAFFSLVPMELPAYLCWFTVSNRACFDICSTVLLSEFSWMNSWINSKRINFHKRTVMSNIFLSVETFMPLFRKFSNVQLVNQWMPSW